MWCWVNQKKVVSDNKNNSEITTQTLEWWLCLTLVSKLKKELKEENNKLLNVKKEK